MADLSKIPLSRIQDFSDIIDNKQNKLVAGTNITIDNTNPDSPVISSTGGGGGRSIGEVFYSQSSLAEDNSGALPLFTGETIASANTIYPEFYNWVLAHTELQCTSEEYEGALSTYGECAKYVVGENVTTITQMYAFGLDATHYGGAFYTLNYPKVNESYWSISNSESKPVTINTASPTGVITSINFNASGQVTSFAFRNYDSSIGSRSFTYPEKPEIVSANVISTGTSLRLPLIKNYIKAANTSEGITQKEAGLPDHTHELYVSDGYGNDGGNTKNQTGYTRNAVYKSQTGTSWVKNSSVYGKSDTVTPAHTTLYPWVVAYTAAIPASTAQAAEFQQGLSGKADTNLGNVPSNYDYVVESYHDADGNWYRVYKSGWIEQGGQCSAADDATVTITFHKPFTNASYRVLSGIVDAQLGGSNFRYISFSNFTTTTMKVAGQSNSGGSCRGFWYACGQGAN